jgi:hypothetical protein
MVSVTLGACQGSPSTGSTITRLVVLLGGAGGGPTTGGTGAAGFLTIIEYCTS